MSKLEINDQTVYLWSWKEITDSHPGKPSYMGKYTQEEKEYYSTHLNFGSDQSETKDFLTKMEFLLRDEETDLELEFTLSTPPKNTPYYVDDNSNFIGWEKRIYEKLKIKKSHGESFIKIDDSSKTVEFILNKNSLFEIFSRLYITNTIYATSYDNIIPIKVENNPNYKELVFWGVLDKSPIFY